MDELTEAQKLAEAEDYCLQAEFVLNELQANLQVFGSNSSWSGAVPANVDLAVQYINRSLEHYPENPRYINVKALLLAEGLKDKKSAIKLLEKALAINPRDINIANNLKVFKGS
jgi:tetratricopeptide (TPR) repeat protein